MSEFNQTSETYTFFTKNTTVSSASGTKELYPGNPVRWTLARVTLISAGGQVVVGFKQDINPPTSGKGRLLSSGIQIELYIPPGQRLYYAADSVQRMAVSFEPLPWLQQILQGIARILGPTKAAAPPPAPPSDVVTGGRLIPAWKSVMSLGGKKEPPKK